MNHRLLTGALVLLFALQSRGAATTFHGDDLVVVGQPYSLTLPAGSACEVTWGDGAVETVTGPTASHVFATADVVTVSVRVRQPDGTWAPGRVDPVARIAADRPVFFAPGALKAGSALAKVLPAPADSFSVACRVKLHAGESDVPFFTSASPSRGACRFGVRAGALFFEVDGGGSCGVPIADRLSGEAWHHVAVTYDRAPLFPRSNRVRFFVDGEAVGDGVLPVDDAGPVVCGAAVAGPPPFRGEIEALAVFDRLLFPLAVRDQARTLAGETSLAVTVAYPGSGPVTVELPAIASSADVVLDPDPKADNGPALRRALAAATNGTRVRIAQPGRYSVRSLVEAPKWAGMLLEDKTDVEFDGNGSTLVFADKVARYLLVDRCRRIAVRNVRFDLDPAYARVGVYVKLLEVDPTNRTVKAQQVNGRDGSPDPLIPQRASYWRWRPHDPKTLRIAKSGPYFESGSYATKPVADPAAGPGVFRFTLKHDAEHKLWKELAAAMAGQNFFLLNHADFSANAVSLTRSSQVTFEQVEYHATLGMVFLADGCDHLRVVRCRIGPPPGLTAADRPLASGSDGYHFHQMHGDIVFEQNECALTDDDPVSIKDSIWPDLRPVASNQLAGCKGLKPGRPVELLRPDYTPMNFTAVVVAVTGDVATVDRLLPADLPAGSLLMDRSYHTQNWILRGNYLHDYYGRVMLYSDHGTVTGNRVHDSLYHLGNSVTYFEKAGACRNVITHGNLFERTNADAAKWGGDGPLPAFHEITYSANSFIDAGLSLHNVADGLAVRNLFLGGPEVPATNRCERIRVQRNTRNGPER